MKTSIVRGSSSQKLIRVLARGFFVALTLLCFGAAVVHAQPNPGWWTNNYYYGNPIAAWSFNDTNAWTSDAGYTPVSYTNITSSWLGDGTAVVVDSANAAWLQYNVTENDGTNNLTVDQGSAVFWFAPRWTSTNEGGTGPGVWGRLIEVGSAGTNSTGWWSLYVDDVGMNIYFSAQTNGGSPVTYLSAPIDWPTTNFWHQIVLTYSATNTALWLDDELMTNGPGMTDWPGPDVLTNGFFIGGDNAGNHQAHGMFDDIYTYNYPVKSDIVDVEFLTGMLYFYLNPMNPANFASSAFSSPSSSPSCYNVITGPGFLQYLGASGSCVTSSNVWMTNLTVSVTTQPITFKFTLAGGSYGQMYDLFATPALTSPLKNGLWSWMGEGGTCAIYSIPNLPTLGAALFILGTPLDSDGDGLTDAYENLVSHGDPNKVDTDGNGMPDGWQVLHFSVIGNNPNSDPDQDGLTNLKEYLYGTDPQVSEGMNVWVGEPVIFVGIP